MQYNKYTVNHKINQSADNKTDHVYLMIASILTSDHITKCHAGRVIVHMIEHIHAHTYAQARARTTCSRAGCSSQERQGTDRTVPV